MALGRYGQGEVITTPLEVAAMAAALESRHGEWAADIAEFFATAHELKGDASRAWAWAGVAEMARRRSEARALDSAADAEPA
jgi:hypothetical protein